MAKKLNKTQERFVERYLIHSNATKAAIEAGYSKKTSYSHGQRLLKHVEIKKRLDKGQERIVKKSQITQDRIADEYRKYGFAEDEDSFKHTEDKDRIKALDSLGKFTGMFRDDRPVDGSGDEDIEINTGGISVALRRVRGRRK